MPGLEARRTDLYSALFEHNHSVMLLINPESGEIVDANRAAVQFYGWPPDELVGKFMSDINTLSQEEVAAAMARVRDGIDRRLLFRHRLAGGEEREVEVYSGPVEVEGELFLYSIVHDVTERRTTENRLQRAESLEQIAARVAGVDGWEVDLAANTVYWSDEVCRIHGLPPKSVVLLEDGINFYAPEHRDRIREVFTACVRDGTPYDVQLEIIRVDGQRRWVRAIGQAIFDAAGQVCGVHGAFQDISDLRREQERLRQLWLAVEQSPESIVITDLKPAIVFVNDAACRISGYRREELLGKNPRIMSSGKTPPPTYTTMWTLLRQGRPWSGIFHNRRKDGREYTEAVSITPVREIDGEITHYLAIKEDITARRATEMELARYRDRLEDLVDERTRQLADAREEAEAASQAKSSFLARMSHEIRTPMNGILGSIEILEQQALSRDQAELLGTIRESGRTLLHIIDDILDFSRIEAGRLHLDVSEFQLAELVEGLCDSMVPLALQKEVDLYCFVAPELPDYVVGDDLRLRQVLANLVGNAVKFSSGRRGRRGRVEVRVEPAPAGELLIEVRDNGIGISPEAQQRLFQPFTQSEESTTRRYGGSGLGLIICQRLTELMHGDIGLESTPGEGSRFRVRLPLQPAPGAPEAPHPDLAGLRVCLEPHELLPAETIERYLAAAGATVIWADHEEVAADVRVAVGEFADPERAEAPAGTGLVLLYRDVRRAPQAPRSGVVALSLAATRRRALLEAVAVAGGRRVPDVVALGAAPVDIAGPAPDIETAAARGELVLVAEDDAINRKVILRQLQLLGRAAEVAADGAEALAAWRRGRTALVLTDLHMPEMDGYALARAVREEERERGADGGPPTPIVALTANALRGEAERVAELGFDDYITKPATLERLRAVLDRWLPPVGGVAGGDPPAATAPGPDEEPVLDLRVLERLVGASGPLVDELLADFLDSARGLLTDIDRACAAGNARQLAAVTHKLKSSARAVGALALGALCERVEYEARAGTIDFDRGPNQALRARLEAVQLAAGQRDGRRAGN